MTQPTNWITDRRPTAADGDIDGDVRARRNPDDTDYCYLHWSYVGAGVPWCCSAFWQPPATPEPEPAKPALTVGQRWRRRDGEVVTVTKHDHNPDTNYPFCAKGGWYDANGNSILKNPDYELIELLPAGLEPAPTPTPRKFASISRTMTDFGHVMDAIDDDGVAWWMMTLAPDDSEPEWHQLLPLPGREVVG